MPPTAPTAATASTIAIDIFTDELQQVGDEHAPQSADRHVDAGEDQAHG